MPDGIPFVLSDYLVLVDWSGRIIREYKKGHIPEHLPEILQHMQGQVFDFGFGDMTDHKSNT